MTPCFVGNPFQDALVPPGEHPGDKLQGGVLHVGVEGRGRGGVVGGFVIAVSSRYTLKQRRLTENGYDQVVPLVT